LRAIAPCLRTARVGSERRSVAESVDEAASRGRENSQATASESFVTDSYIARKQIFTSRQFCTNTRYNFFVLEKENVKRMGFNWRRILALLWITLSIPFSFISIIGGGFLHSFDINTILFLSFPISLLVGGIVALKHPFSSSPVLLPFLHAGLFVVTLWLS
jgi:hypothetical protein